MESMLLLTFLIQVAKMSNRHLIKKNKAKKGISPVVATVILVAVAVVIAAALAGFSGSLFSSYSNGPQIKIQSMTVSATGPAVSELVMSNAGSAADTVLKVHIEGVGDAPIDEVIPANSSPITLDNAGAGYAFGGTPTLDEGQQVTAVISLQSGATITQTVTVTA